MGAWGLQASRDLFLSMVAPEMSALLQDLLSRPHRLSTPPRIIQSSDVQHAAVTGAPGILRANLSPAYYLSNLILSLELMTIFHPKPELGLLE